jgi:hypothetical protein
VEGYVFAFAVGLEAAGGVVERFFGDGRVSPIERGLGRCVDVVGPAIEKTVVQGGHEI